MKAKASITLSEDTLKALDALGGEFKNRSEAIENAVVFFLDSRRAKVREQKDLKILNQKADKLNREAKEVLSYQIEV
ncbi:MAG: hypothetical protein HYU99_07300 [Deltaproteobacteria bacterium]|nr:hypothetical protein [Deltaproteobacteria bacterium]